MTKSKGKTKLPPGIHRRGAAYRVSVSVDGVRRTGTAYSLDDALSLRSTLTSEARENKAPRDQPWRLSEAMASYRDGVLAPRGTKAQTVELYHRQVLILTRLLGEDPVLDSIDDRRALEVGAAMTAAGWSPGTRKNVTILLKALMKHAAKMGRMSSPPPEFTEIRVAQKRPKFFTPEQESAILTYLEYIGDLDLRDLAVFLADTGLRAGVEALPLEWGAINFPGAMIQVWGGKGGKHRAVPMTTRVRTMLQERKLRFPGSTGPFTNTTYHSVQQRWTSRLELLGLYSRGTGRHDMSLHAWRHTYCTRLVSAGVDLRTVQELAGHSSITTTMIYAHFVPARLRGAVQALEAITGNPGEVAHIFAPDTKERADGSHPRHDRRGAPDRGAEPRGGDRPLHGADAGQHP